jgi:uncharacterized protein
MPAANTHAFDQLHKLLEQLDRAEKMLELGPRRIAVAEKKVAAAQDACSAQKEEMQQLRKAADEVSLTLKTSEAGVAKHKQRLNDATANKEYQIIQGQITAAIAASGLLEDQVLNMLGDVDVAGEELSRLQQEVVTLQQKVVEVKAEVLSREPGLTVEIQRVTAEIAEVEKVIPGGEAKATYRRLRGAMGAAAMARMEDNYCSECNTEATPQDRVQMNMGEFILCRRCGRILYNPVQEADV